MAAYMRGVMYLLSIERNAFLVRRSGFTEESKRYLRGLRRRPVTVLFPESDTGEKTSPRSQPAEPGVRREGTVGKVAVKAQEPRDKARSTEQPAAVTKDQIDGLRFERAFPGDKRLA